MAQTFKQLHVCEKVKNLSMKISEEIQRDPIKSLRADYKSPEALQQHLQTWFIHGFSNHFNSNYRNFIGMKTYIH